MDRKILTSSAVAVLLALSAAPRAVVLEEGFLPPNDMSIAVDSPDAKGITQDQFNAVMDRIQDLYEPVVASQGGRLVINRLWSDPTVNASAERDESYYIINMYGGLARHESITQDGMALVACHEMGHHVGGAPKYGGSHWASNEGQADYFANLKCLRRVFTSPSAASFTRPKGDVETARAACDKWHTKRADRDICVRASMAGMSVTDLFRVLRNETVLPRFDTPDPRTVNQMDDDHPRTQCRLDTYFAASLCPRPVSDGLDESNPDTGTCTRLAGYTVGLRPRCWYKSRIGEVPKVPTLASALDQTDLWKGF